MNYYIREVMPDDCYNGLLETLNNLSKVNIQPHVAEDILAKLYWFNSQTNKTFVAANPIGFGEHIIGTATIIYDQKLIHTGGIAARIEDVVTHPNFKGKGVATSLINECISDAKQKGCYKIILNCKPELTKFYQKSGFNQSSNIEMRMDLYGKAQENIQPDQIGGEFWGKEAA